VCLVARLRTKDRMEWLRIPDLPHNAMRPEHCNLQRRVQHCVPQDLQRMRRRELWAWSRMTTRKLGSLLAKAVRSEFRCSM
jgi:hypothetical protein